MSFVHVLRDRSHVGRWRRLGFDTLGEQQGGRGDEGVCYLKSSAARGRLKSGSPVRVNYVHINTLCHSGGSLLSTAAHY